MFTSIIHGFLVLSILTVPTGKTEQGPSSIRRFRPLSTEVDDAMANYFEEAGPIAIEFQEHVSLLANQWFEGREPGSEGSKRAGEYIVWNFERDGLTPAFDGSWYQPFIFEIDNNAFVVTHALVAINSRVLEESVDYVVLGNSGNGNITAPVTFVGYAIEEGKDGYSSFDKSTDLTGQIALMLRYEPLDEDGVSQWAGRRFGPKSAIRDKMQAVIDRGAAGVILVNPPNCRDGRVGLETMRSSRFGKTDIPVVQFDEIATNRLLRNRYTIAQLQRKADKGTVNTIKLGTRITLETALEVAGKHAQNIGGVLQGRGALAHEWVVIGGHYDHLGHGYTGTASRGEMHVGADDNASGTAAVMILARLLSEMYASTEDKSLRSVLFLLFDAEEAGLHGSDTFVKDPTMELDDINVMINMDMVGRLRDNKLSISGTGTATEFEILIPDLVKETTLTASLTSGGTGPSDHTNFYHKDIPVLFFFTGITEEYHTPQDKIHTINPAGASQVIELVDSFAEVFVDEPKLHFSKNTATSSNRSQRMSSPVRLGVHPSYTESMETGILLSGISEGTSADAAGLQAGDILLAWDDTELTGGRKLMELLKASAPGDVVTLTVQRNGQNIEIDVTLQAP